MLTPEQFQEQILPYLYDVLDAEERRHFEAALQSSESARARFDAVKAKLGLLAAAVKEEFADVTFKPPVASTVASKPALRSAEKPPRFRAGLVRWAVAAALVGIILLGGGFLSISGWVSQKNQLAQARARLEQSQLVNTRLVNQAQTERIRAQQDIRAIQEQINRLVNDWNKEAAVKQSVMSSKHVQLTIDSPRGLQAGATNSISIEMKPNPKSPAPLAKPLPALNARLVDQAKNQVLYAKVLEPKQGLNSFKIDLPPDLPLRPDMDLAFEVKSEGDGAPIDIREHLTLATHEYVTHLVTDRPMYRPGETVHYRSLTLDRFSMKPAPGDMKLTFRITDPNGGEVSGSRKEGIAQLAGRASDGLLKGPDGQPLRAIGAGDFVLPADLPGGIYALHVAETANRFPPEKRAFIVHRWQAPSFNKDITFDRASYGPGDIVQITATAVPVAGGPATNLFAQILVTVDQKNVWTEKRPVQEGKLQVTFTLPPTQQMTRGDGTVSITFHDGGNRETIVRPIPILLGKMFVDFYPEGGDLIEGLQSRVYLQATTVTGKPADLQGRIVDSAGATIAKVQTLTDSQEPGVNQGLAVFEFVPQKNQQYELKIDAPTGMHGRDGQQRYRLPQAKQTGVVLRLPQGVVEDTVDVDVTSAAKNRRLLIGAYCRGKLIDHVQMDAPAGKRVHATLRPTPGIGGVYRITVFEKLPGSFVPIAERLIYRNSPEKLRLAVTADKEVYQPGEHVRLSLTAENEKRERYPSILMVSVVDLSVHKLVNDKTARSMPTHFLLTSEVRNPEDLENADFFLGTHPKARQALDLLLGVQGWRRFAEQDPVRFQKQNQDAVRIVQAVGPGGRQKSETPNDVLAKVDSRFAPKFVELQENLAAKEKVQDGNPETQRQLQAEKIAIVTNEQRIAQATGDLESYESFLVKLAMGTLVIGALLLGILLLYIGMVRLSRGRRATVFFVFGSLLLAILFMGSLVGTAFLIGGRNFRFLDEDRMIAFEAKKEMQMVEAKPFDNVKEDAKDKDVNAPLDGRPDIFFDAPGRAENEGIVVDRLMERQKVEARTVPMALALKPPMPAAPERPMLARLQQQLREPMGGDWEMAPLNRGVNEVGLRQAGNIKEILRRRLGRAVDVPSGNDAFIVREYAHVRKAPAGAVRTDFAATLYWHPALVLADGKADIGFDLSDANTRYQVLVYGHTLDGRLGASTFEVTARMPLSVEPKVPVEVTSGDTVVIPVAVANDGQKKVQAKLFVTTTNLTLLPDPVNSNPRHVFLDLEPRSSGRALMSFQPAVKEGQATVRVAADFGFMGKDAVERAFKIVPEGFPVNGARSGLLEKSASHEIVLPESWIEGTLKCQVQVFPSTLAELQKGLEALLREPCGCFEQSSTSNYPNVLILNYLKEADLAKPDVEQQARALLKSGYGKLTSFECLDAKLAAGRQGYEWFGQTAPPHEALTAYGLLQFKDMAKVYPVDEAMLQRTRQYLLGQRDGKGAFKRNPRSVDSFGRAPDHITNAYIVWALTESGGDDDLSTELKALYEKAKDATDPYFVALVSLSHINRNQSKLGVELLKNLAKAQKEDGHLDGAQTSITGSGGRDLVIETTGLATLGWLKANRPDEFNLNIDRAVKWLGQQRGAFGSFGSTQSTILALKALIAHAREHKKPVEGGNLQLFIGDQKTPAAVRSFSPTTVEPLVVAVPDAKMLKPGPNQIRIEVTGHNEFPYTLSWSYQTLKPANPEKFPVHLSARLDKAIVKEGDTVRLHATVENKTGKGQGMAVAIIGLPGGLALPEDFAQLKEMTAWRDQGTKPGLISAWELRGRELVLYWRDLAPDARIEVGLDLISRLPGSYRGPAPRAYLYYNADNKFWSDPLAITIQAGE